MENLEVKNTELDLKELGLEELEVSTDTMLDEMGASMGINGCCSVIVKI